MPTDEKVGIKGVGLTTTVARRYIVLQLHHHNKASLLSDKLHAILQCSFTKGRDIYDLLWYLSDPTWPEPNLILLNNALAQTNWDGEPLANKNWGERVWQKMKALNWSGIVDDVRPFVEPGFNLNLLTLENFKRILNI